MKGVELLLATGWWWCFNTVYNICGENDTSILLFVISEKWKVELILIALCPWWMCVWLVCASMHGPLTKPHALSQMATLHPTTPPTLAHKKSLTAQSNCEHTSRSHFRPPEIDKEEPFFFLQNWHRRHLPNRSDTDLRAPTHKGRKKASAQRQNNTLVRLHPVTFRVEETRLVDSRERGFL
jgi:hypothetical protein